MREKETKCYEIDSEAKNLATAVGPGMLQYYQELVQTTEMREGLRQGAIIGSGTGNVVNFKTDIDDLDLDDDF